MAEHISWGDVILVVFLLLAFGPWEGELVGPGLEQGDQRQPWGRRWFSASLAG